MQQPTFSSKTIHRLWPYMALGALAICWGSSFILMKRALYTKDGLPIFSYSQVAAARVTLASVCLLPLAFGYRKHIKPWHLLTLVVSGLCGVILPAFLYTAAQRSVDSGVAGLLTSLTPVFTLIFSVWLCHTKVTRWAMMGIFVGISGAAGLVATKQSNALVIDSRALLIVVATALYGFNANIVKKHLSDLPATAISAVSLGIFAPILVIVVWTTDISSVFVHNEHATTGLLYIAILSIFCTTIAAIVFNKLLQRSSAVFASSVTYLIPITALAWGYLDGETLGFREIFCASILLMSVKLISQHADIKALAKSAKVSLRTADETPPAR